MEFIDGEDLSAVLAREGAFPVERVVRWTDELLDGLDYLHSQDPPVIHRDIKPGNLKLTSRGNIILLDFGLAKESETNTLAGRSVFGYSAAIRRSNRSKTGQMLAPIFFPSRHSLPPNRRRTAGRRPRTRFSDRSGSA